MPAVSKKQEKFMRAVAENPKFAKKVGVPQSVGREFTKSGGGMAESKAMMKKEVAFMKKKGAPKSMVKHEMKEAGMKKGSNVKKMAMGGMGQRPLTPVTNPVSRPPTPMPPNPVSRPPTPLPSNPVSRPPTGPRGAGPRNPGKPARPGIGMNYGGKVKKMATGGLAAGHKAADGVARKGKTKAMQVKMAGGGKTKKYC